MTGEKIRDHVEVVSQPTVVRLEHLRNTDSGWISRSFYITEETGNHLRALRGLLAKETGCGIFLIGHYGSGKSHFLAYVCQQLEGRSFSEHDPDVLPLSLVHYKASESLESIVAGALALPSLDGDRRRVWDQIEKEHPGGLLLVLDELSEFLRSKPTTQSFNEDLRFLQFLGEWAQGHRFWLLAALQEQIEHTGDMEYDLYRKIKDRYPVRLLITPAHVKDLISQCILRKKPSYRAAVEMLANELRGIYPAETLHYAEFCDIYPLHPATLALLDEVRDRFSQTRGIIDFTLTRLLGSEVRGTPPFLDQPWGQLITPDAIVDHFSDLFELQPEFVPISQKVLTYYRRHLASLFDKAPQRELAWRLLQLLILVHLSPLRKDLSVEEASLWLLLKVSSIDPAKNREVIQRMLETMVRRGAFLKKENDRYSLDLEDDSGRDLDQMLAGAMEELTGRGDGLFELLLPCLERAEFNPFTLPRDRWHSRRVQWCFHEREIQVYFGSGTPPEQAGLKLQIGIPWGPRAEGSRCYTILPAPIEITPEILELAALMYLKERPLPARVLKRIEERLTSRAARFSSLVRGAYRDAEVVDPMGARTSPPLHPAQAGHQRWLNVIAEWMLRQTYPRFERFAPGHGPLPREAYRQFMKWAIEHDLGAEDAPEYVKLIREAYLVPMELMLRRGADYLMSPKLDRHELIQYLTPILEHHPTPGRVYEHLSAPVYGLVPDQIHLLLLTLLVRGDLDIIKGNQSLRDVYETLINPLQYDRIVPGRALSLNELRDLEVLCSGFHLPTPKHWSVLAQKRTVDQLRRFGSRQRDQLSEFLTRLRAAKGTEELAARVEKLISCWLALDKGEHELQGFQQFLFETGSPQGFVAEAAEITSLPARLDRLLRETQRFRHLFSYPCVAECADPGVPAALQALGDPPSPARAEELEAWLEQAARLYARYQRWYQEQHKLWRERTSRHPAWSFSVPGVARSRHLALGAGLEIIQELQTKARLERCAGLSSLEFQPLCRCGFDGRDGPVSVTLQALGKACAELEADLNRFFMQEKVKARIREWVDQRIEMNTPTLSYLEGKTAWPEVVNIALFDQHLAGLELVRPVIADSLLELIGDRVWEKHSLMKELELFFERCGSRIVLQRDVPAPRTELALWCTQQALRHGCPLPSAFSSRELDLAAANLQPDWISEKSLLTLEKLGLGENALQRVLGMILDGLVRLPGTMPASGPVAAACELLTPKPPASPEELARKAITLYGQNQRLLKLRPEPWRALLDQVATTELPFAPRSIQDILADHLDSQWIVVDCLGILLLEATKGVFPESLPRWRLSDCEFGLSSAQSSTDAFYRKMLENGVQKSFEKVNAIDDLIHGRQLDFDSLARLARTELEIAFKKLQPRLDPSRYLLIFGDHGFRLAQDGSGFVHGGYSTLERLVPIFTLVPY